MSNKPRHIRRTIGLMVFPLRNPNQECGQYFVCQLLSFLAPQVKSVVVLTANFCTELCYDNVTVCNVKLPSVVKNNEMVISKVCRLLLAQLLLSIEVIKKRNKLDTIMLYLGAPFLVGPAFSAYIMRKRIVVINTGSDSQSIKFMYPGKLGEVYSRGIRVMEHFVYLLSSRIIVLSESMIAPLGIERYRNKVMLKIDDSPFVGANSYIDTDRFSLRQSSTERADIVGYIGRLSGEKGVVEFVEAIPMVASIRPSARFLIVGDGSLLDGLKRRLEEEGYLDRVEFMGYRPHIEISSILNRMKFLVVPSYTEVVAATAIEAMACGTICLATPVGATKDIVIEGERGFILEDNQPSTIAVKLLSIWDYPDLERIQRSARMFVENNFARKKVEERWTLILDSLGL